MRGWTKNTRGLLALMVLGLAILVRAQASYPTQQSTTVNDYASILAPEVVQQLETLLTDLQRSSGIAFTVVTLADIHQFAPAGQSVETFATGLFNQWGIGDSRRNDGVLLLVAVGQRTVRIEVGSGYGDELNTPMQQVIEERILPYFRNEDYNRGIYEGVRGAIAVLTGTEPAFAYPDSITLPSSGLPINPVVGVIGTLLTIAGGGVGYRRWLRYRPRQCNTCGQRMRLLDEIADNQYLDPGQSLEEELKSVDYDVWLCDNCHSTQIFQYTHPTGYKECPQCHHYTLSLNTRVIEEPTYSSTGLQDISRDCRHCNYHTSERAVIAMLVAASSSSSDSSWSSSDSGSFDGGSSSGGGASGSW